MIYTPCITGLIIIWKSIFEWLIKWHLSESPLCVRSGTLMGNPFSQCLQGYVTTLGCTSLICLFTSVRVLNQIPHSVHIDVNEYLPSHGSPLGASKKEPQCIWNHIDHLKFCRTLVSNHGSLKLWFPHSTIFTFNTLEFYIVMDMVFM